MEVILKASKDDCSRISEIYNHYLGKSTMDTEVKSAKYYHHIIDNQDDMEELWSLKLDQYLIAWGIIKKYSPRAGYQYTGETSVYCDYRYLRRGYGTSLKKHLMTRCKSLGYHHLLARINSDNNLSISYNQKLGYTIVGRQHQVGYINGVWKDVTIMQYIIDS